MVQVDSAEKLDEMNNACDTVHGKQGNVTKRILMKDQCIKHGKRNKAREHHIEEHSKAI